MVEVLSIANYIHGGVEHKQTGLLLQPNDSELEFSNLNANSIKLRTSKKRPSFSGDFQDTTGKLEAEEHDIHSKL